MKKVLCILLFLGALMSLSLSSWAAGKVLVIHSYHAGYDWVDGIDGEIKSIIGGEGTTLKFFYMDTKQKSNEAWKKESADLAMKEIESYSPDVIIAVDDNAQQFVVKDYIGKDGPQFVFAGVNAELDQYGFPAENVTGVLERTYAEQGMNLLLQILPDLKKVAYIADDSSTATLITPRSQEVNDSGRSPLEIVAFHRPSLFNEWKELINKYNADNSVGALIIPLYHTVKDNENGDSIKPSDVMAWIVENSKKPVIGYWPFSTKDGALCAVVVDPKEHGKVAANMALQILGGKKAGDIPVVINKEGFVIINIKTASKLNIDVPFNLLQIADEVIQ